MTEYDYSPEAYERYLQTQRRISNWVDRTEGCRPQFANALSPPSDYMPSHDDVRGHHDRPGRRPQRRHPQHLRSRSPSEDSCSSDGSDDYVHIQRPSPPMRSAPAYLGGGFPAHQLPWNQPPPPMTSPNRSMPNSYYGTPSYREVKHRRAHSYAPHIPRPGQHYGAPGHSPQVVYVSPPVSPGMYPGYRTPPQSYVIGRHPGGPGPMPMVVIHFGALLTAMKLGSSDLLASGFMGQNGTTIPEHTFQPLDMTPVVQPKPLRGSTPAADDTPI